MMRHLPALTALFLLAACGSQSGDGVGGISASEASALNDAAAMLDAQRSEAKPQAGLNPAAAAAARADRRRAAPGNQTAAE